MECGCVCGQTTLHMSGSELQALRLACVDGTQIRQDMNVKFMGRLQGHRATLEDLQKKVSCVSSGSVIEKCELRTARSGPAIEQRCCPPTSQNLDPRMWVMTGSESTETG